MVRLADLTTGQKQKKCKLIIGLQKGASQVKFFNLSEQGTTYVSEKHPHSETLILTMTKDIVFGVVAIVAIKTVGALAVFSILGMAFFAWIAKLMEV